jgi:hypothetical protein
MVHKVGWMSWTWWRRGVDGGGIGTLDCCVGVVDFALFCAPFVPGLEKDE